MNSKPAMPMPCAAANSRYWPITGRYERFAREHGIEIAGFEFIETADGRLVTYDINTTTNYNAAIEAAAPRPALPAVARFLSKLLAA